MIEERIVRPETFGELWTLCQKLKSENLTFCLGEIVIKTQKHIEIRFTTNGNIWYEHKKDGVTHLDILFTDKNPSQMWDVINGLIDNKKERIKNLEKIKEKLFNDASSDWIYGHHTRAEDKFAEACKIREEINRLKEEK